MMLTTTCSATLLSSHSQLISSSLVSQKIYNGFLTKRNPAPWQCGCYSFLPRSCKRESLSCITILPTNSMHITKGSMRVLNSEAAEYWPYHAQTDFIDIIEEDNEKKEMRTLPPTEAECHFAEIQAKNNQKELKLMRFEDGSDTGEQKVAFVLLKQSRLVQEWRESKDYYFALCVQFDSARVAFLESGRQVSSAKLSLHSKEQKLEKLAQRDDQIQKFLLDFRNKCILLREAIQIINKQQNELRHLHIVVTQEEKGLRLSETKRMEESIKLEEMEGKLHKRWVAWYFIDQEMKKLAGEISRFRGRNLSARNELPKTEGRVSELRNRLVVSERNVETLKNKLRAKEEKIKHQRKRLSGQRCTIEAYESRLRDTQSQVEREREMVSLAEEEKKRLECEMVHARESIAELKAELLKDRESLQQKIVELDSVKDDLENTTQSLEATGISLHVKEAELLTSRLQIQNLHSEMAGMQFKMEGTENDLKSALMYMDELHLEISEVRSIMRAKEHEVSNMNSLLHEYETKMGDMQVELDDSKLKLSQSVSAMANIAQLTKSLVDSEKSSKFGSDEDALLIKTNHELFSLKSAMREKDRELQRIKEEFMKKSEGHNTDIEYLKGLLVEKEKETLDAKRALMVKEEEVSHLKDKWEERERSISDMRNEMLEEANGLSILHANAVKKIGDKTIGELALENLESESAKLEAEARKHTLKHLTQLDNEPGNAEASSSTDRLMENASSKDCASYQENLFSDQPLIEESYHTSKKELASNQLMVDDADLNDMITESDMAFKKAQKAIMHLTSFTEQLLHTASTLPA